MENQNKIPIDIRLLLLDPRNPRFVTNLKEAMRRGSPSLEKTINLQYSIRKKIKDSKNIKLLRKSIIENGFKDLDPLIVKSIENSDKYIVIEGNRRIGTVLEILDDRYDLELMSEENRRTLEQINCIVYPHDVADDELDQVLGIRHLVGIQNWDELQKALMFASFYEENPDVDAIATSFGHDVAKVNQYIKAVALYNWILENTPYADTIQKNPSLDIFIETCSKKYINEWFGYKEVIDNRLNPIVNHPENVEKFAEWMANDIIKSGRFDVRAFNSILATANADYYISRIENGETPQQIQGELTTLQKGNWIKQVRGAINSLEKIKLEDVENLKFEEKLLLEKLVKSAQGVIIKHQKLVA